MWHDDGIIECHAILTNFFARAYSLRSARAKLQDVQEALHDAAEHLFGVGTDDADAEGWLCLFDALAFTREAMRGPGMNMNAIRNALLCLERLKTVHHVHQV